ncbi:MAG: EAL domain-containing protein [Actinomycetota bacterium]
MTVPVAPEEGGPRLAALWPAAATSWPATDDHGPPGDGPAANAPADVAWQLEAAAALTGLAWWEYDARTDRHTWSDRMWELSGLDPAGGSPTLADWLALVHPEDRDACRQVSGRTLAGPHTQTAVFRLVTPDGDERLLQSWSATRTGPDGEVTGMFGATLDISERDEAERALRETEQRLRAAQQLTGLAPWSWDLASGRLTWSDEMFALVGREPGSVEPDLDLWLAHIHPDDREVCERMSRDARAAGRGYQNVFRIRRYDGELRWVQAWSSVALDRTGTPVRIWGVSLDVTEREVFAAALRESEKRIAEAYALTGLAWWEWHADTDRLSWSDGMRRLVGVPEGVTFSLADWQTLVDPEDQAASLPLEQAALEHGTAYLHVFRVRRSSDGSTRFLQSWTGPLRDGEGRIIGLRGATLDVTERELAVRALAASERHFRVAFDNAPIGMATVSLATDGPGRLLQANGAFAALLGYPGPEVPAYRLTDLVPPEDAAVEAERLTRLVAGQSVGESYQARYRRGDGSLVHVWVTTAVVHDAEGRPQYAILHCVDDTERRRQRAELERLAHTDELTGLANRTVANERLRRALARLGREGGVVGLLLLDLDRFKLVNDSLGHPLGDALLVEAARRLRQVTRADTTVARLGGDEFVLVVEGARSAADVHAVASRAMAALRRPCRLPSGDTLTASCSIGVAIAAGEGQTPEDLFREADLALYQAKDAGRDRYAVFDDALRARAVERVETEARLRAALLEGGLRLHLQPIVDLAAGTRVAAEALVRVEDGAGGLLPPARFVRVAEDSGLITQVDGWVVDEVVGLLGADEAAQRAGGRVLLPPRIAVNVSGRTVEHPGFVPRVRQALAAHRVSGRRLLVEITESTLLATSTMVADSLRALDELGVQVGLDDFGTGYSALAYLQRFRLQFLKIDMSFVRRLGVDARADALVKAVVDLAHAHDLVVTAEGVETAAQAAALRAMGCDQAQGWLFGRPCAPADGRV